MPRRPKLGQHFLSSPRLRERIADALGLSREDLVVEIGPGRGALTQLLAERARRVVAIEVDAALARTLREKIGPHLAVEILEADILSVDIPAICRNASAKQCYVFGNLPYYITSPILRHLLNSRSWIQGMALLLQREVAERITAKSGGRAYGYLSVFVQLFSEPRLLFRVPPGAFSPPPRVHSALVVFRMTPRFPGWSGEAESSFLSFAKRCFAQKRKSLVNNIAEILPRRRVELAVENLQLAPNVRAEQLTLEQLAALHASVRTERASNPERSAS